MRIVPTKIFISSHPEIKFAEQWHFRRLGAAGEKECEERPVGPYDSRLGLFFPHAEYMQSLLQSGLPPFEPSTPHFIFFLFHYNPFRLSSNSLGNTAGCAIGKALEKNATLTTLS